MKQKILTVSAEGIGELLQDFHSRKFLLVHDGAFRFLPLSETVKKLQIPHVCFDGFTPNPLYENVCIGAELFRSERCDTIVAVGGGSTLDVAKCIKLYSNMNPAENYLTQEPSDPCVPLIAIPTTAGTGSESTRYAVIYYEGKKQSVTSEYILPDAVILDSTLLKTLPIYQKKCTLLDALCQGIESWWSVNSTDESKGYAKEAVESIKANMTAYLTGDEAAAEKILKAANLAGRAINITQTTAPHAMSYKLTSLYKLPHGHAVAICLPKVWRAMLTHIDACADPRGQAYLCGVFKDIAKALEAAAPTDAIAKFEDMLTALEIRPPHISAAELDLLAASVNPTRLKNNPVTFAEAELREIYAAVAAKA